MNVTVKTTAIATPTWSHDFIADRLAQSFSWVNGTKVWLGMLLKRCGLLSYEPAPWGDLSNLNGAVPLWESCPNGPSTHLR